MKYIKKEFFEPGFFKGWKKGDHEDWVPSWGALDGTDEKKKLKEVLMKEQGYICCYCNIRISNINSHIEHFRPKNSETGFPEHALNYQNLIASCTNKKHCGMKKDNWFDEQLLLSPLNPDCEIRFGFYSDGRIYPVHEDDLPAKSTISRLGLDRLNKERKKAIEASGLFDIIDELSRDEINLWIETLLEKDEDEQYTEFCMAVVCVLKNYTDVKPFLHTYP